MIWYDMIWYDMIWYDMIWYIYIYMIWCDIYWYIYIYIYMIYIDIYIYMIYKRNTIYTIVCLCIYVRALCFYGHILHPHAPFSARFSNAVGQIHRCFWPGGFTGGSWTCDGNPPETMGFFRRIKKHIFGPCRVCWMGDRNKKLSKKKWRFKMFQTMNLYEFVGFAKTIRDEMMIYNGDILAPSVVPQFGIG